MDPRYKIVDGVGIIPEYDFLIAEEAFVKHGTIISTERLAVGYAKNTELNEVHIPEGVTMIRENAFNYCTTLKIVELPSTLEFICRGAFSSCCSIEELVIPSSIRGIEKGAFRGARIGRLILNVANPLTVTFFADLLDEEEVKNGEYLDLMRLLRDLQGVDKIIVPVGSLEDYAIRIQQTCIDTSGREKLLNSLEDSTGYTYAQFKQDEEKELEKKKSQEKKQNYMHLLLLIVLLSIVGIFSLFME